MRHAAAAAAQHCRNTCIVRALFQHSSHSSMQLFCDGQCTCWLSCMLPKLTSSCSRLMNASCHCTVHGVKICDPADLHTSRLALSCIFGCSVIVEVYSNCHSATTSWCILSHTRAFARTVRCERPQKSEADAHAYQGRQQPAPAAVLCITLHAMYRQVPVHPLHCYCHHGQ